MTSDPTPKRSDDETEAETVKRRLIDAVRERIAEIGRSALENSEVRLSREAEETEWPRLRRSSSRLS